MAADLIHDRGRGPEIVGTRITVYHLLPYFLDPTATETYIGELHELTAEQVASARAYVLNHPDTVLAKHLEIEERLARGNPPEVVERARQTHDNFLRFKDWLAERQQVRAQEPPAESASNTGNGGRSDHLPSFCEWLAEQGARAGEGS